MSRMNFSGFAGHVTIFSRMFTIACCLVVGLGLGLGLGLDFIFYLVTGDAHLIILFSVVIVTMLIFLGTGQELRGSGLYGRIICICKL